MKYLHQPNLDPVLVHIWGPLQIRWYSLLYVGGFLVAQKILKYLTKDERFRFSASDVDQLVMSLLIATVIGARIVYCVVYDPAALMANPLFLFQVYKGGLSFHGALIGIVIVSILFARRRNIPFWNLADALSLAAPTGLAMGRIGNFINGELYGRVSEVPWAIIFRDGGPGPRHPSQIYEFLLEGVGLFLLLWLMKSRLRKDGQIAILFLIGYSACRFIAEFFREPDVQVGYLFQGLTMGQVLSLIMFFVSVVVAWYWAKRELPDHSKTKEN